MTGAEGHIWMLSVAATALASWWLAVRPGATYRATAPTVSVLIILMAVMMLVVALDGWTGTVPGGPRVARLAP